MAQDIFQDIMYAIDYWLQDISSLEERLQKIESVREKIDRTISRIETEGQTSIVGVSRLTHVGDMWIDSLEALKDGKRRTITLLFDKVSLENNTKIVRVFVE